MKRLFQWLLCVYCVTSAFPADYYLAPGASGDGTLANPGAESTAMAHTGWAASIAAGDTVYYRAGTYTYGTNIMDMQFSGSAGNLVTWRNYPGERAIINHPIYFTTRDYHRFIGLEFYDSNKAMRPEAIGYFDSTTGSHNEWINCIIHDTPGVWTGYSGGAFIRGCIIWNAGKHSRDHIVYPHTLDFSGNIVGWTSGTPIEQGVAGTRVSSNVFFGTGITINEQATALLLSAGTTSAGQFVGNNVIYESLYNARGITFQNLTAGVNAITNNIVVATDPMRLMNAYSSMELRNNTIFAVQNVATYVLQRADGSGIWSVNGNNYYSKHSFTTPFLDQSVVKTFATWKSDNAGFDTTSTATIGSNPPDSVTVFPNGDDRFRTHIAIFNWSGANNVAVNLTGIIQAGNTYTVRSVQNYSAILKSGTFDDTSISIPMTNRSVAPVLYSPGMTQPSATTPNFDALVVISGGTKASGMTFSGGVLR